MNDWFNPILMSTLKFEGGETVDTGGHTNYGITQNTYDAYSKSRKLPRKSVSDLSMGDVRNVYKDMYWDAPKVSAIPYQKVAGAVFDYGVNAGTGKAIKDVQKIVGVQADGVIGKKTLSAINEYVKKYGEDGLAREVLDKRIDFYSSLVMKNPGKYGRYIDGWTRRVETLKKQYGL